MDKREQHRVFRTLDVIYRCDGVAISKRISDLSEGGVFIDTSVPADLGTEMQLQFEIGGMTIEASGRVVHKQAFIGMGIEFVTISAEHRALIRTYVEQRALAETAVG